MIETAAQIAIGILILSLIIVLVRIIIGPSLPDKVISLDLISILLMGMIVAYIFLKNNLLFVDIILIVTLLFFMGTAVIAKYLITKTNDD